MPRAVGTVCGGTVMGLMGLLTCRHQRLVLGPNRAKRAQRPGEDTVGNRNFPLKGGGGRPAHNFHPPTSCAAPQPTRSISTKLIYDKPDLVFLSRFLFLAACAHTATPAAFSHTFEPWHSVRLHSPSSTLTGLLSVCSSLPI